MQAIAHGGVLRQDFDISPEVAREMIEKTPRRLRSKFAAELAKMRTPNVTYGRVNRYADSHGIRLERVRPLPKNGYSKYLDIDSREYFKTWRDVVKRYGPESKVHNTDKTDWEAVLHRHGYKHEESGKYQGREFHRYVHPSGPTVTIGLLKSGKYGAQIMGQFGSKETPAGLESILTYLKVNPSANNPGDRSAESLSEEWHGREPVEVIDFDEVEEYEPDGAILAQLEELGVLLEDHEETLAIEFGEDPPMLVANVTTDTLEVVGGDQHLDFGEGWDTSKSEILIGHVYLIAYNTDKHHLEGSTGNPESYEHFFGEEYYKGRGYKVSEYKDSNDFFNDLLEDGIVEDAIQDGYLPTMVYDTVNSKIRLVGGRYTIEDVGLRD
jgi:hypothetical protein